MYVDTGLHITQISIYGTENCTAGYILRRYIASTAAWSMARTLVSSYLLILCCLPCLVYAQGVPDNSPELMILLTERHSFFRPGIIYAYKLKENNFTRVNVSRVITPTSVDYDKSSKLMYWTDISTEKVMRASLDGGNNQTVASLNNVSYPEGIAIDADAGKIFYTDRGNKFVARIEINGFNRTVIVNTSVDAPWGIVADKKNKLIYWADHRNDSIWSCDYNGMGVRNVTNETMFAPTGLALNENTGRLYWCQYDGAVSSILTSGVSRRDYIMRRSPIRRFMDIALYNGFLYITDRVNSRIVVIPESGGEEMTLSSRYFGYLNGIHVFSPNTEESGCSDGMYGVGCTKRCGKCREDTTCEKTTGVCIGGCSIGYTGAMCTDSCTNGTYGVACYYKCGHCKTGTKCDPVAGDCPSGCDDPWTGLQCRDRDVGPELVVFLTRRHSYFTRGRIYKLTLHHMNFTTLAIRNVITPTSIDIDSVNKRVYWTDVSMEQVRSVDIHGHRDEIVAQLNNISYPEGIVVDGVAGKLFYTDRGNKHIVRIDLNGYSNATIVGNTSLDTPWGITADKTNKQLYWVDHGSDAIVTSDYDGNGVRNVTNATEGVFAPTGIAINEKTGRLYWCQYNGAVYSILKDGTDKKRLLNVSFPIRRFMDISLFNGFLYITDRTNDRVTVIPESGGQEMQLRSSSFYRLNGLHVYSPTTPETGCADGKYGVGCTSMCGKCTTNTTCEKTVGVCLARCAPGYIGELCDETCASGLYGKRCNKTCSQHCSGGPVCNFETGTCTDGCEQGWTGDKCEDIACDPGSYGVSVCLPCGKCKNGAICDSKTGACPSGCKTGWKGDNCQSLCSQGTYGDGCTETCGACAEDVACDPVDGTCPAGCLISWSGNTCKTKGECPQGSYGQICKACGNCKAGTHCYSQNGHCPEGCQENWQGPRCDVRATNCAAGTYGPSCYSQCGRCKNDDTCDGATGACPNGCKPGWTGSTCKAGCLPNYYGDLCKKQCGYCKSATYCDPGTGICPAGCIDGWKGSKCDTEKGAKTTSAADIVKRRCLDLLGISMLFIFLVL